MACTGDAAIEGAHAAFQHRDWAAVIERFAVVEHDRLSADDFRVLGEAAWWTGAGDDSSHALIEAYQRYRDEARPRRAAMMAMLLAAQHRIRGAGAVGSGWLSRARHLLRDEPECKEAGYLLHHETLAATARGEFDDAVERAERLQEIGRRLDSPNLLALGLAAEGRALVKRGDAETGLPLLDEAMLTAIFDDLHLIWMGEVYRQLMDTCHELFDLGRAAEWTRVVCRRFANSLDAVSGRGICGVRRAHLLRMQGRWQEAEDQAALVVGESAHLSSDVVGEAYYELGEIRRLRGDLGGAEDLFRRARALGRDAQPGLALLRLDQGRPGAAVMSIRSALVAKDGNRLARARLCGAQIEIAIAVGDTETMGKAGQELWSASEVYGTSGLRAEAACGYGAISLASGKAEEALGFLHDACRLWQKIGAPYRVARTRLLIALAYRELDDQDAAALEFDAARDGFDRLGAALDARRLLALRRGTRLPAGLTEREAEVLRYVAAGDSNRRIATVLRLSEKTVARHLSNIFTKLGLSSRTAAAGYAFENGLASRP
ncbi:helix-turn-helix transcriptional regulator [Actinoallomurus bryophytorum]|uniref:helix-turn-helix transcriptional regulator n=1 Tax=Actinoallomurus bryophytorum TaxID=1490222 RepID=UPI00114D7A35|nr:LuxR C-terminal-related transcriptional regulator [Actinoallomurus bryophytorum]